MSVLIFLAIALLSALVGYLIADARTSAWKRRAENAQSDAYEARKLALWWELRAIGATRPIGSHNDGAAWYSELRDFAPRTVEVER